VNGIYWEPKYPRLLTVDQTAALLARPDNRLICIADISCDIEVRLPFPDDWLNREGGCGGRTHADGRQQPRVSVRPRTSQGSVEVTAKATTIDRPVIFFNGREQPVHEEYGGDS